MGDIGRFRNIPLPPRLQGGGHAAERALPGRYSGRPAFRKPAKNSGARNAVCAAAAETV